MTTEAIAQAFGVDPETLIPAVSTVNPKNEPKNEDLLSMIEKIHWSKESKTMPDADETVIIATPTLGDPVWLGYYDGTSWITVEGYPLADGVVEFWAPMPRGPQ